MPLPDRELWACANELIRQHGNEAPAKAAERMEAMQLANDRGGAETWQAILARIIHLTRRPMRDERPN